ncbi:MAG: hypothetical protein ABJN04_06925 [Hyphomicrobiales bacterium]
MLTITPQNGVGAWPPDGNIVPRTLAKKWRENISSCLSGHLLLLGGIDFSLNREETGFKSLNAHLHCIISRPLNSAELKRLKDKFPRDPALHIYKPVTQKPICKGDLRSVGEYCCKTSYTKRSSFIAVPLGDRNPYRDGRDQSLSAKEDGLFTDYLSDHQVCDHIITHGLKRVRTSDPAEVRLMLTTKK